MCRSRWLLLMLAIGPAGCRIGPGKQPPWIATDARGMVASDSPAASRAGAEILAAGGNAVDAAAAVSFALAVTRPESTGLGGGGFMIVRMSTGEVMVLDYRETAPVSATADMYDRVAHSRPHASRDGPLAAGVPGTVAGQSEALRRLGTMPLSRVLQPAIRLARDGYPVDDHYIESCADALVRYRASPDLERTCPYVFDIHLRRGNLRRPGEVLRQPELVDLLEGLAEHGPAFFYAGPVAQAIADEMARGGGLITTADLANYRVRERHAIRGTFRGYELLTMPPPSSGGVAVVQALNILEPIDLATVRRSDPTLAAHYTIEAMKHAFADRARYMADPDFVSIPTEHLLAKGYARRLFDRIRPQSVGVAAHYGTQQLPEDRGTSHFCVADSAGNVVVCTETVNTEFGSLAAASDFGLILNNEMDDFAARPGVPNAYGLTQSRRNAVAPNKRPLSSMTPTIVLRDGEPVLLLGASGGPRIITSVLNVMLNLLAYDMPAEQALEALRPHHQWLPETVFFDRTPDPALHAALVRRGHSIADRPRTGVVQLILRTPHGWLGASDPRKGGTPAAP